ncbi:MAG: serine hydrolase [Eubacteriales bacterium]
MYKSGSGKIQSMDDGTTFTIKDFFEYTLLYSDNVAYQQLRKRYGYSTMTALASKLGTRTLLLGGNSMSARDAGTLFKEIYRFVQNDEGFDNASYGNLMKNAMLQGNHTVIIPSESARPARCTNTAGTQTPTTTPRSY